MGSEGKKLIKMDVNKLIDLLNKALADEWLAYYQYWIGAKVAVGPLRSAVIAELEEHAGDELRHAGMLVERIIQLDGTPILKPEDWYKLTNCGYEAPEDPSVVELLKQNIKGEQCAIRVYDALVKETKDKDMVTYHMALEILKDEIEHENDLEAVLDDIHAAKKQFE